MHHSYLTNLPTGILLIIHSFLDMQSQLTLQATSQRWAKMPLVIDIQDSVWNYDTRRRRGLLKWLQLPRIMPYVDTIRLSAPSEDDVRCIGLLPSLRMLHLSGTTMYCIPYLTKLTKLQRLSFDRFGLIGDVSGLSRLIGLKHFLCNEMPINNLDILHNLPKLSRLELTYCYELTSIPSASFLTYLNCQNANRICQNSTITNFEALWSMPTLRSLYMSHTPFIDMHDFTSLTALEVLHIPSSTSLTSLHGLWGLTRLYELNLYRCNSLIGLNGISALTGLTLLNCNFCRSLTTQGCIDITRLTALRELHFTRHADICDLPDLSCLTALTIV